MTTLLLLFTTLLSSGCSNQSEQTTTVRPAKPTVVRFGTLIGPATYEMRELGPVGIDYELALQFSEYSGLPMRITPFDSLETLFSAFQQGELDIMAAGLTRTELREQRWTFSPPLYQVTAQLVYRQGRRPPKTWQQLEGTLQVVAGSSHQELLQQKQQQLPSLSWQTVEQDSQQLLKLVADGVLDYTIADSTELALSQRYFPSLRGGLELTTPESIGWVINNKLNPWLTSIMLDFWSDELQGERLARLEAKYFGHVQRFDYVDTLAFIRKVENTLPKYEALFKRHANQFDWRQLAALSYQESHWNPKAKSPTGVRGLMMLTLPTAKRMKVSNRLDPEQSIRGGSAYLQQMMDRLPPNIPNDERFWFALAAYNIGLGHLEDARVITQRMGFDPNNWHDVAEHLPLLRKKQHYQRTRYGYARGDEAAHYVENIRRYYDTLLWLDSQSTIPEPEPERTPPPTTTEASTDAEPELTEPDAGEANGDVDAETPVEPNTEQQQSSSQPDALMQLKSVLKL
ncbi:membrane-bound lytic murein transglycosylase MltF [Ferrimonas senticii]|uniref:membrane-bound lytic murein transglycosylase MltF n=1 Tax=Ferrimonas senticii TaxID=394566 RepID=UPI0004115C52|nr:membrane-bound lytic murein transglycosylase MltF [Ferrimonas senticii]